MEAILGFMDLHLWTLEKIIKSLIQLVNNKNLFILQELLKKKQVLFIFTKRRSMDLVMEILFSSGKSKEWKKLMENNIKSPLDLQIVSQLEILLSSVHTFLEVLLLKLKSQYTKNSFLLRKVCPILILLNQKKCQFAVGRNSDILSNCMLF